MLHLCYQSMSAAELLRLLAHCSIGTTPMDTHDRRSKRVDIVSFQLRSWDVRLPAGIPPPAACRFRYNSRSSFFSRFNMPPSGSRTLGETKLVALDFFPSRCRFSSLRYPCIWAAIKSALTSSRSPSKTSFDSCLSFRFARAMAFSSS